LFVGPFTPKKKLHFKKNNIKILDNMKITKAVFPVAGFGTRFLPATKSIPKEMIPIVDKPAIQYLVEEAQNSGIEKITIVSSRHKQAIENHFDDFFELEYALKEKKKNKILEDLKKIGKGIKFTFVRQSKQIGDGDAILRASQTIFDESFAVVFGDDIVKSKTPAIAQLEKVFWKTGGKSPVIAFVKVPKKDTNKYGVAKIAQNFDGYFEVKTLVEKPKENPPSNFAIIGRYICTPEILKILKNTKSNTEDGEIRLVDAFLEFMKNGGKIYGVEIEGDRYDTGDKLGFLKATVDFALNDGHDFSDDFRSFLKNKF